MNKFQKFSSAITAMVLVIAISLSSCKKNFDQPPYQTDPALVANTSLATLKALHTSPGAYDLVTTDIIISGVVIADDRSGNLYKQIFIRDSTGALQIDMDASNLYGTFPVGRKVFIKCKGLTISDYKGTPQLGVKAVIAGIPSILGIPANLIGNYVYGGTLNNPADPIPVTAAQLGTSMTNRYLGELIQLSGYEFQVIDTSKIYSDTSAYKNTVDLYIRNCASTTLLDVRTSGYSNFAGIKVPKGNGTINSIYTIYNSGTTIYKQLYIRDTSDVQFTNTRCGGSGGGGGGGGTGGPMTLAQFRALYSGSSVTIAAGTTITGKVISNNTNEANGNYRIEDASGAGIIFFAATGSPTYPTGTVLTINAGGGTFAPFNGDLELSQVSQTNVTVAGSVTLPAIPVFTIAQIIAQRNILASSLVKIVGVTSIVGAAPGTTGTNYTVTDATGNLVIFVRNSSGIVVNTAGTSVTGYVGLFNAVTQIGIRTASDIQ